MPTQFKTIGIIARTQTPGVNHTLRALTQFLEKIGQSFVVEEETAATIDNHLNIISRTQLAKQSDLVIVIGGDGSLLHAAHLVVDNEVPILGINRGRLGFLTDILPSELEKIKAILQGEYRLEKRFLLSILVQNQGKIIGESAALNEVALIPDSVPHMNEFEIYIDDQFLCSQDSDGVIIATPTGSTAYALSGGGPILHPQLDALVIVPMFPHTLTLRPIVIEGSRQIKLIVTPNNTATPRITCDGQTLIPTPPGSHISIQKKAKQLHLIHPFDYDYYQTLRSKLHWGQKLNYVE